MDQLFNKGVILERLETDWLGRQLHLVGSVGSTNDLLQEMATAGATHGTLVLADYQHAGKGRRGRRWHAPPGTSLLTSVLFRPDWPAARAMWLMMIAGLAAAEAIEAVAGITVGLKWPNDLMVAPQGSWLKVGGLLLETALAGGSLHRAVLGTGINVNIPDRQLPAAAVPAASLLSATGRMTSRLDLLSSYLQRLEQRYEAIVGGQSPQPEWNRRLIVLGQSVSVSGEGDEQPVMGLAEGTDDAGRLLVRTEAGRLYAFAAGDVTLRS
ncbi:MAG: biotin--[acetyl-CoA-carboxylase] ligase [Candidatus Promineifilaceae bacterium]|nr:biotin--[acetyl-CoA-carboxylase] ligase [Candidatus Promineifilaceae bacterium]